MLGAETYSDAYSVGSEITYGFVMDATGLDNPLLFW